MCERTQGKFHHHRAHYYQCQSRRSEPADKMCENDKSVKCENAEEEDDDMFEQDLLEDAQWKRTQQNTFTRWANEKLKTVNRQIDDLECDLSDGLLLISLIEVLAQKKLPKHSQKPVFRSQKLENVSVALKFLDDEGIRIVNIGESTDTCVCVCVCMFFICIWDLYRTVPFFSRLESFIWIVTAIGESDSFLSLIRGYRGKVLFKI